MKELVKTEEDAARFLARVRAFHDGFIQEITVTSRDAFEITGAHARDVGHVCTGEFDMRIIFAHHPSIAGDPPKRVITRCVFKHVAEVHLDFRLLKGFEWPLHGVRIEPADRDRLRLLCQWTRLSRENEWEEYTQALFVFRELEALTLQDG